MKAKLLSCTALCALMLIDLSVGSTIGYINKATNVESKVETTSDGFSGTGFMFSVGNLIVSGGSKVRAYVQDVNKSFPQSLGTLSSDGTAQSTLDCDALLDSFNAFVAENVKANTAVGDIACDCKSVKERNKIIAVYQADSMAINTFASTCIDVCVGNAANITAAATLATLSIAEVIATFEACSL